MTEPGDLLGTSFRVREVLTGGMGQIFICDWESQEAGDRATASVALKTFQRRYFFDNAARLSFVREASTWLRLSHLPHIMPVIQVEQIADQPYIMMPAVPPGPGGERASRTCSTTVQSTPNLRSRSRFRSRWGYIAPGS